MLLRAFFHWLPRITEWLPVVRRYCHKWLMRICNMRINDIPYRGKFSSGKLFRHGKFSLLDQIFASIIPDENFWDFVILPYDFFVDNFVISSRQLIVIIWMEQNIWQCNAVLCLRVCSFLLLQKNPNTGSFDLDSKHLRVKVFPLLAFKSKLCKG